MREVPTRTDYLAVWSASHGGYDIRRSRWAYGWLCVVHALASPLVRLGFSANALTLLGGVVAVGVPVVASRGGLLLLLAAVLVVVSALLDGLDGAVAVMTGRTTAWGALLDSLVDRVGEGCYLLALWLVGAPPWICLTAGVLVLLHEYARARALALGVSDIGVVTVWERPTRVVVTAMFLLGAGLYSSNASVWATVGAYAWLVGGACGLAQLLWVLRRRLA